MTSRLVQLRRRIHARPEVGFTEIETAAAVVQTLGPEADSVALGRDVVRHSTTTGLPSPDELEQARRRALEAGTPDDLVGLLSRGHTGVVVTIKGERPGLVTGLRFDMDALPVQEADTDKHLPFREGFTSVHDGVMHACGHDGHVAIGVELGLRLAADRDFPGEVRLIFQPAEEGVRGALTMLNAGVTNGVQRMLGLHLGIGLPLGTVAASVQGIMATEKWSVVLTGQSSHAALAPEDGRHAILGAATATLGLHTLPQVAGATTRLNVGAFHGGTAANVVPDCANLLIELRADTTPALQQLKNRARRTIAGAAQSYDLEWRVNVTGRAVAAHCNDAQIQAMLAAAEQIPAITKALPSAPMSASDDVTLLMEAVQHNSGTATFALVGAASPAPHHHPSFDIDEHCLAIATDWLEAAVRRNPHP
ncbi:MAG: amidohydrolase [Kribbellaceae bacterium]|nr:amidohydrolase [Catenulispora sp.]NUR94728.1 amidohydrolase [Kribbellaceae bacterium]